MYYYISTYLDGMRTGTARHVTELLRAIQVAATDATILHSFLRDLLTPGEFEDIVKRWQIIQALARGKTHREVAHTLQVSVAKVSRGARVLQNQKSGFRTVLTRHSFDRETSR